MAGGRILGPPHDVCVIPDLSQAVSPRLDFPQQQISETRLFAGKNSPAIGFVWSAAVCFSIGGKIVRAMCSVPKDRVNGLSPADVSRLRSSSRVSFPLTHLVKPFGPRATGMWSREFLLFRNIASPEAPRKDKVGPHFSKSREDVTTGDG